MERQNYFFAPRNRGPRNDLLSNMAESHTALFTPNLLQAAQNAIKNIHEELDKDQTTDEMKTELRPILHYLLQAADNPLWKLACTSNDLCYVLQGHSDTISRSFDVRASYMGRFHDTAQDPTLTSADRLLDLLTALDALRREDPREGSSWKDAEELEEELATKGLQQLKEQELAKLKQTKPKPKVCNIFGFQQTIAQALA